MEKAVVIFGVVLLAGCVMAFPKSGAWRREAEDVDRSVEAVPPTRTGVQRRPEIIPLGVSFGLSGLGGFGGLPTRGAAADDVDDDDADGTSRPYLPGFVHPFMVDPMSNFMAQMAEMMTAMRRQMDEVLKRLPDEELDLNRGNTTSTTKVINGHVVTVNDTTITRDEDGIGSVVHIRVVDVHPTESPTVEGEGKGTEGTQDSTVGSNKDVEPLADKGKDGDQSGKQSNEIPKSEKRAARVTRQAQFRAYQGRGDIAVANYDANSEDDDEDDVQQHQVPVFEADDSQQVVQSPLFEAYEAPQQRQWRLRQLEQQASTTQQLRMPRPNEVEVYDKETASGQAHADLSRDTLVNTLLEKQHSRAGLIMVDPDAELMDVRDGKVVGTYSPNDANRRTRRTYSRRPY